MSVCGFGGGEWKSPPSGLGLPGAWEGSHHPTEDQDEVQPLPRVPADGRMAQRAEKATWLGFSQDVVGAIIVILIIASIYRGSLGPRRRTGQSPCVFSFRSGNEKCHCPHFTDEETEAQTCSCKASRSHSE